nr:hypothetical protein Josef01_10c16_37 [uncultured archaeon]
MAQDPASPAFFFPLPIGSETDTGFRSSKHFAISYFSDFSTLYSRVTRGF